MENSNSSEITDSSETYVIPVVEEQVRASKRTVDRAKVRIERHVDSREESISDLLNFDAVEVTRVPVDRPIDRVPSVRQEGDEIIVPVLEERLVVQKQIFLKEEVRIRRRSVSETKTVQVELRRESVEVSREEIPSENSRNEKADGGAQ